MKFRIVPKEDVILVSTKGIDDLLNSIEAAVGHTNGSTTKFAGSSEYFIVHRKIINRTETYVNARGTFIHEAGRNLIRLKVTCDNGFLQVFAIFWYVINFLLLCLFASILISNKEFDVIVLLPIVLIFVGYGFSTASLQSSVDELISDVKRACK